MKSLKKQVMTKLEEVLDPELHISIIDLGLIYDVSEKEGDVAIKMTLTTLGCPLFETIESEVKDKLKAIKGIKKINIDLVFDPPWTMERMSEKAKAMMGI